MKKHLNNENVLRDVQKGQDVTEKRKKTKHDGVDHLSKN